MRGRILAVGLLVATLATVPLSSDGPQAGAAQRRPNILIIVTDDQRGGLGFMPATRKKFVRTGRSMKRGLVTTPLCCPSRASIFTGRYTHNHGVSDNFSSTDLKQGYTFQAYLKRAGYRTAYIGKYFNRWPIKDRPPHFHRWSIFAGKDPEYYSGGRWNINGKVRTVNRYATSFIEEKTVSFLRKFDSRNDRRPWLAVVAPTAPHHPFRAERKYRDARVGTWAGNPAVREKDRSDKPPWVRSKDRPRRYGHRVRRKQMRTLMSVDDMVKRIFKVMRRLDEQRDTFAVFISDNGYMWGEHGLGGKRHPYTPSYSVPFMMRWPGRIKGGSVERRFAANIDIHPTVLDAAGIKPVHRRLIDGRSLLKDRWKRPRMLLEQGPEKWHEHWASTLTRRFQYIEYYDADGETVIFREYYNLKNDRWQLVNLYEDDKLLNDPPVGPLHERLAKDRRCKGDACP